LLGAAIGFYLVEVSNSRDLKKGILTAIVFPVLLLIGLLLNRRSARNAEA
jgi:hypothetical protein